MKNDNEGSEKHNDADDNDLDDDWCFIQDTDDKESIRYILMIDNFLI
jgi:hypothetical protein